MRDGALWVELCSTAIPDSSFAVYEVCGEEAIGRLFHFDVLLVGAPGAELDEDAVMAAPAELTIARAGRTVRRLFGVVVGLDRALDEASPHPRYRLSFAPRASSLALVKTCEVFLDASLPEILASKLAQHGLELGRDVELRLRAAYPKREIVVQYKETDLAFVSRLAEHYGVSLFLEHDEAARRDVLVFSDDMSGFRSLTPGAVVAFAKKGQAAGVQTMTSSRRVVPAKVQVADYNYRTPGVALSAEHRGSGVQGRIVEHGVHAKTPAEAQHLARVRAEEIDARRHVLTGSAVDTALEAARRFTLEGHPRLAQELLLVETRHSARQAVFGFIAEADASYVCELVAISASTPFRPARTTPKPVVAGVITGVVEAASEGSYAELDDHGRYHVRFLFDEGDAPRGRASHLVRMAQPHAGPGYGFHFPLRDGVEVVLTCIDGDPDRPVIAGAVPNPTTPSTVVSHNGMRNVIRTGGGNEINIDDREGFERIKLTTPYANTFLQLGAPNDPTPGAVIRTFGQGQFTSHQTMVVQSVSADAIFGSNGGNAFLMASVGNVFVKAAVDVDLHGDAKIVGTAPVIDFKADGNINLDAPWIDAHAGSKIRVGSPAVEVNGGASVDVGAGALLSLTSGAATVLSAGDAVLITAGSTIVVSAPTVIVKSSTLQASGDTVSVSGATVNVTASGTANIKGGVINLNG